MTPRQSNNESLSQQLLVSEKHEKFRSFHFNLFPLRNVVICITEPAFDYVAEKRIFNKFHLLEYIEEGKGEFSTKDGKTEIRSGQTLFIRKNTSFSLRSNQGRPFKKISILFSCYYLDELIEEYRVKTGVYSVDTVSSFQTLHTLFDLQTDNKIAYIIENALHQILMNVSAQWYLPQDEIATNIKNKLESSIYKKCNLDAISDELGLTKSAMVKLFKKTYGVTPYQYVLDLKIGFAKEYLVSTNLSVKSIALLFAFTDEHYFSFMFSKKINQSPSEYRKKYSPPPISAEI